MTGAMRDQIDNCINQVKVDDEVEVALDIGPFQVRALMLPLNLSLQTTVAGPVAISSIVVGHARNQSLRREAPSLRQLEISVAGGTSTYFGSFSLIAPPPQTLFSQRTSMAQENRSQMFSAAEAFVCCPHDSGGWF